MCFWSKGCLCFAASVGRSIFLVERQFSFDCVCEHNCIVGRKAVFALCVCMYFWSRVILFCCVCEHICICGRNAAFAWLCV